MKKITSNKEKHYLAVTLSGENDKEVLTQMASALQEEGYVKRRSLSYRSSGWRNKCGNSTYRS